MHSRLISGSSENAVGPTLPGGEVPAEVLALHHHPDSEGHRCDQADAQDVRDLLQQQVAGGSMGSVFKALDRRLAEAGADIIAHYHRNEAAAAALVERLGCGYAVRADLGLTIAEDARARARVIAREDAVLSGAAWCDEVFRQIDASIEIEWRHDDGDPLSAGVTVCELRGRARTAACRWEGAAGDRVQ